MENWSDAVRKSLAVLYWSITVLSVVGFVVYQIGDPEKVGRIWRNFIMVALFVNYFSKLFAVLVLVIDDLWRGIKWIISQFASPETVSEPPKSGMSRSEFLSKTAIVAAAVPALTMSYGILSGAHDYRVRRSVIKLPHLPVAFDGIRIGQISDIHSGSFFNKKAVKGGVEMLMREKPDLIFFTGDLVNNMAEEVKDYISVFEKVKAPLGVFSTLGNHDYGDYMSWPSLKAKIQNLEDVKEAHRLLGYQLLMNENRHI